ncbi:hypothetical protein EGW08_002036, partial [Elysia chlorotica]
FAYFFVGCVAAFASVAVHYKVSDEYRGTAVSVLSFLAKMAISGCWGATSTWVVESYPTVTRSVGYGWVNMTARIGGIIAPFALDLDYHFGVSYIVVGILQVICLVLTVFVPETRGTSLPDNMTKGNEKNGGKISNGLRSNSVQSDLDPSKDDSGGHLNLSMEEIKI